MGVITYENLRLFCYSGDRLVSGEIKGIVLNFYGLGGAKMLQEDSPAAVWYAERGLIFVNPYTDPWDWMNPTAVALTDEIIDVLFDHYQLPDSTPIISSGGSMGGLCSIVYCRYARRTPAACVANCPVCDLPFHYTERPDLPRTLYAAFYRPGTDLMEKLKTASPLHLADSLPDIPYILFHCTADKSVNIHAHSEKFAAKMQEIGRDITLIRIPDRGHCDLGDEGWAQYQDKTAEYAEI